LCENLTTLINTPCFHFFFFCRFFFIAYVLIFNFVHFTRNFNQYFQSDSYLFSLLSLDWFSFNLRYFISFNTFYMTLLSMPFLQNYVNIHFYSNLWFLYFIFFPLFSNHFFKRDVHYGLKDLKILKSVYRHTTFAWLL